MNDVQSLSGRLGATRGDVSRTSCTGSGWLDRSSNAKETIICKSSRDYVVHLLIGELLIQVQCRPDSQTTAEPE